MREILFRGKRPATGEWVEGCLLSCDTIGYGTKTYIIPKEHMSVWLSKSLTYVCEVTPYTVGQYTGFKDKTGKMVFEGDIVKCEMLYDNGQYPKYVTIVLPVVYADGSFKPLAKCEPGSIEVIGNIHNNPELL